MQKQPKRQVLVAIEEELINECVMLGGGDMSAGIRLAISAGIKSICGVSPTEGAPPRDTSRRAQTVSAPADKESMHQLNMSIPVKFAVAGKELGKGNMASGLRLALAHGLRFFDVLPSKDE